MGMQGDLVRALTSSVPHAGMCIDTPPSGGSCVASECNSTAIIAGPYCLKTCGRCSATS
jgi:hypothetical protein